MGFRIIRLARISSRCKGDAVLVELYSGFFQVHLPVHLPCYDLPPLYRFNCLVTYNKVLIWGEWRAVCACFRTISGKHSASFLTSKSSFMRAFSALQFVLAILAIVAHFFPSHTLHLGLTFWAVPVLRTTGPSQGGLTTAVYRREKQEKVRLNGGYRF